MKHTTEQIKTKIAEKGLFLPSEIELCSRTALHNIEEAFKEIDNEELTNPSQRKLTSIQRNRMAINYLEMNEIPKKYLYYKRFLDEEDQQSPIKPPNSLSKLTSNGSINQKVAFHSVDNRTPMSRIDDNSI